MQTFEQLFTIAKDMGMSDQSATEMANEHIARRDEVLPVYVCRALNAATDKVNCAKTARFLDRKFGFNSENVHGIFGMHVNRHKITGEWIAC